MRFVVVVVRIVAVAVVTVFSRGIITPVEIAIVVTVVAVEVVGGAGRVSQRTGVAIAYTQSRPLALRLITAARGALIRA